MNCAHYFVLAFVLAFFASISSAQVPTSAPPFGSFGSGPDIINLANLNAHIAVPILHKAGRGTNFTYDLSYDSSVWYPVTSGGTTSWNTANNWGWRGQTEVATGYLSYRQTTTNCGCTFDHGVCIPTGQTITDSNFYYHDSSGVLDAFPGSAQSKWGSCGSASLSLTSTATDGSGYTLHFTGSATITSRVGTVITPPINSASGAATATDRNGNEVSVNGGVFTDTLGTTALTVAGSGTPSSPMTYTYNYPVGPATITAIYTAYTVQTKFACSGIADYGPTVNNLVSEIDLPDGSKYSFAYEGTPGVSGSITGRLASVTLPMGGTITYAYTGGNNGINCADGSAATLARVVNDGSNSNTWTYAQVKGSGAASTTTVTDPQSNVTSIQFQGIYETHRVVNQGATTVLRNINTCYNGAASPCTTTAITLPITQKSVLDQYGTSGPLCKHVYSYNAFGVPTEIDDYDYPSGTVLLRKTTITYASLGNITVFPQTTTVYNGASTQIAQTTNNYDETTPTATSGLPQHVAVSGSRGNLTSVNHWLNTTNTNLTSHNTFYDTGMVSTSTDPNGHATTYTYSSTFADAYPTTIANALGQSTTINYDPSGVITSVKDPNNQTTGFTYDGLLRLTKKNFPDGGETDINFNTATNITTATKMNSSQNISNNTLLDGLGRTKQTQLQSDPQGTDFTDTTYDSLGRVSTVSNPYRSTSDPTYGVTTVGYDPLNHPTSVAYPDGSIATASYSNNITTVTDEAGKKRQLQYDALGRITQVTEDPNGLAYVTTYGFDALNNLTSVVQGSNQRTHNFDSLSRMISETNPETGTITYKFDADANCGNSAAGLLASKTDARGIRTCYFYDALNRVAQKTYSDGTLSLYFSYDVAPSWMSDLTNVVGRLVEASNQTAGSSGSTSAAATVNSYDSMGRVVRQWQQTPSTSPGGYFVYHSYDLAGDSTQTIYPSGRVVQQSFDSAGRLCAVAASTSNCSTFTTPYATAFTYDPASQVTGFNYGNGVAATFGYSNRLQKTSLKYASGINTLFNLAYNFGSTNNNGQIAGITDNVDNGRSVVYGYDSLNRLSSATTTGSTNYPQWGLSWNYDRNGNRTAQNVTAGIGPSNSVSVNAATNQINTSGYSYDLGGNMTNDGNNTLTYDAENRVTSATNGSASGTYFYDGTGLRIHKISGGATTDSIYSGSQVIAQYDSNQNILGEYVYVGGQQLAALGSSSISNGGFEQGLTGWTDCVGNAQVVNNSAKAHSGNNYLQISTSTGDCVQSTPLVPVAVGDQVDFGGWVYLESGTAVYVHWNLLAYNATQQPVAFPPTSPDTVTAAAWTYTAGSYTVPAGVAYVQLYAEVYQPTGTVVARFDDGFLRAGTRYYHPDHLSTRLITDASGNLAGQQGHFPFGETWYAQNTTSKWQFTSYEHDAESSNDYAIARSYVNRLARFSSPDPAGLAAVDPANPQSWNRYSYVANNPLNATDPSGLIRCPYASMNCSLDGGGGGGFGCQVDGVDSSCSNAQSLLGMGAAAQCPQNVCNYHNGSGQFMTFQAFAGGGPGGYYANSGPGALYYSADQAGMAALNYVQSQGGMLPYWDYESNELGAEEPGGNVYLDQNGVWSFTNFIQGPFCADGSDFCTIQTASVPIPAGATAAGLYHAHSDWWIFNPGGFSVGDMGYALSGAFGYSVPSYLLTAEGTFAVLDWSLPAPHTVVLSGPPLIH